MKSKVATATAIAIAIIAVVILIIAGAAVKRYENYLSGMWIGDPAFLKKAGLSDMQLFVAPPKDGTRQGYLIMVGDDGKFVANQAVEIDAGRPSSRWSSALGAVLKTEKDMYRYNDVEFTYDDSDKPMPTSMNLTVSMLDGSLTLYDGDKVYAFFARDHSSSAAAVEAYSS